MGINSHKIHPSQFIHNYGPGALIETTRGPRLVLNPGLGLLDRYWRDISKYEIGSARMSVGLLGNASIFRLPTNNEMPEDPDGVIYRAKLFPEWHLCINYPEHAEPDEYVLYRGRFQRSQCPVCKKDHDRRSVVNFVAACPKGHLDDVYWYGVAHGVYSGSRDCEQKTHFIYHRGTGATSSVEISCPRCGSRKPFSAAYAKGFACTGRRPESEPPKIPPRFSVCTKRMRVVGRHTTSLRLPELWTLLEMTFGATDLEQSIGRMKNILEYERPGDLDAFVGVMDKARRNNPDGEFTKEDHELCRSCGWDEIKTAIDRMTAEDAQLSSGSSYSDLILDEYKSLVGGTKHGIPPQKGAGGAGARVHRTLFEMRRSEPPFKLDNHRFIVSSIPKLSALTVQYGYRRSIRDDECGAGGLREITRYEFKPANQSKLWYPGVRSMGEGLFVMLEGDGYHPAMEGRSFERWNAKYASNAGYDSALFRTERDDVRHEELHPVFVWWHTLSHALLRVLGEEAGYPHASLHERIFLHVDGGRARGGMLLYVVQAGREGSLGGLVSMAPHMEQLFRNAMEQANHCSGDPLCRNSRIEGSNYNGAACYGCIMASETSCEHRNMWLDRHLLIENPP